MPKKTKLSGITEYARVVLMDHRAHELCYTYICMESFLRIAPHLIPHYSTVTSTFRMYIAIFNIYVTLTMVKSFRCAASMIGVISGW